MEYEDFLRARRRLIADVIQAAFRKLRTGELPFQEEEQLGPPQHFARSLDELLGELETERVEFKSSAYYSYRPDVPERIILESVVKTVAGFLNAGGGLLAIGIADDGEVLGIQPDLDRKKMDADRYVNSLTSAFEQHLGSLAAAKTRIEIQQTDGVPVCLVHVARSPTPVYAKVSKGESVFFLRVNNSTRTLEGPDLVKYVKDRWG